MGLIYVAFAALGDCRGSVVGARYSEFGAVFLNTFLCYLFGVVAVLPHELAHAITAHVGLRVFKISLGVGKKLFTCRLFGWTWDVHTIPMSGFVLCAGKTAECFRLRLFAVILAGPAANLAILLCLLHAVPVASAFAGFPHRIAVIADLLIANIVILFIGLWPHKGVTARGVSANDGLSLLTIPFMKPSKINESLVSYYALEGMKHLEEGDLESARKSFAEGLRELPESTWLLNNMAVVANRTGDYDQARRLYERLLLNASLDPRLRSLIQNNLAYAYAMLENDDLLINADQSAKMPMTARRGPRPSRAVERFGGDGQIGRRVDVAERSAGGPR